MRPANAKPCPFCGEQPIWTGKTIQCRDEDCEIKPRTAWYVDIEKALFAWNQRKGPLARIRSVGDDPGQH